MSLAHSLFWFNVYHLWTRRIRPPCSKEIESWWSICRYVGPKKCYCRSAPLYAKYSTEDLLCDYSSVLPCRPLLTDDRRINGMKVILCHHASFSEYTICLFLQWCKNKQLQLRQLSELVCEIAHIKLSGDIHKPLKLAFVACVTQCLSAWHLFPGQ